jgi:hypothetical protein
VRGITRTGIGTMKFMIEPIGSRPNHHEESRALLGSLPTSFDKDVVSLALELRGIMINGIADAGTFVGVGMDSESAILAVQVDGRTYAVTVMAVPPVQESA